MSLFSKVVLVVMCDPFDVHSGAVLYSILFRRMRFLGVVDASVSVT